MKNKRSLIIIALIFLMTVTSTLAYVTTTYNLFAVKQETVTVGNTVVTEDGIVITLASYDNYGLTYFDVPETDTEKHYLTYSYNYNILINGYDVVVTSVTDDIIITDIVYGTTIDITFSLNQTKNFVSGDLVTIQFLFELQMNLNGYTATNPIDINNTTYTELIGIGLTDIEANNTIQSPLGYVTDINNWADVTGSADIYDRYIDYVDAGVIVFN